MLKELLPTIKTHRPVRLNRDHFNDYAERPMAAFEQDVERLFNGFWRDFMTPLSEWDDKMLSTGQPRVDLAETEDAVEVTVDLPGLSEKDVTVNYVRGALEVEGEKSDLHEDKNSSWLQRERFYGRFYRRIPMISEIDEDRIEAKMKNGVLTVHLPKTEQAKSSRKRIEIKA